MQAQTYPVELCQAICKGAAQEREYRSRGLFAVGVVDAIGEDPITQAYFEEEHEVDDPDTPDRQGLENAKSQNQLHIVAPGEGKTPQNLIFVPEWDAKAFWALHPDGKNNLTDKRRPKKLSDLEYFKQRLNNADPRWRRNIHWVFSAAVFRENIDFQRNIDLG